MRAFKKLALTGALACAALPLVAGPAAADVSPPAYLERTQYLTSEPSSHNAPSCISRDIYLAAGWYEPVMVFVTSTEYVGGTHFGSGTYSWSTCLMPLDTGDYAITDVIGNGTVGLVVNARSRLNYSVNVSGTYTWGTALRHYG